MTQGRVDYADQTQSRMLPERSPMEVVLGSPTAGGGEQRHLFQASALHISKHGEPRVPLL